MNRNSPLKNSFNVIKIMYHKDVLTELWLDSQYTLLQEFSSYLINTVFVKMVTFSDVPKIS